MSSTASSAVSSTTSTTATPTPNIIIATPAGHPTSLDREGSVVDGHTIHHSNIPVFTSTITLGGGFRTITTVFPKSITEDGIYGPAWLTPVVTVSGPDPNSLPPTIPALPWHSPPPSKFAYISVGIGAGVVLLTCILTTCWWHWYGKRRPPRIERIEVAETELKSIAGTTSEFTELNNKITKLANIVQTQIIQELEGIELTPAKEAMVQDYLNKQVQDRMEANRERAYRMDGDASTQADTLHFGRPPHTVVGPDDSVSKAGDRYERMAVMDELNNSPEQRRQMGAGLRNLLLQQERAQHVGDPQAQEPHQPSAEDYDIPTHQANQLRQPTPILEERESQGKPSSSSCQKHDYDRGAYDAASSPHGDTHPSVSDTNAARSRPWTTRPAHVHDPPDLGRRIPSPLDVGGTTGSSSTSEPLTRESKAQDALSSPIKTHAAKKNHTTTMTPPLKADYPVSDVWSDVGSGWDFGGAASSVADSAHLSRFTGVGGLDDESDFFAPEVEKNRVANRAADGFELRRRAAEQHRALAAQTPPATAGRAQSPIDIGSSEDRHTHNVAGMPLESSLADQSWSSSPRTLGLSTTKTRSPQ